MQTRLHGESFRMFHGSMKNNKFQFIVLLFITQIAGNCNNLAAGPGRDVKIGKLKNAIGKCTVPLNGGSPARILMLF